MKPTTTAPQPTLTPVQIQAFNKITGANVSATPAPAAATSRAAQIRAMGTAATPASTPASPVTDTTPNPVVQGIENFGADTVAAAKGAVKNAGESVVKDAQAESAKADAATTTPAKIAHTEQGIQHVAGDVAGGAEAVAAAPVSAAVKNISDLISQSPAVQKIAMELPDFQKKLADITAAHPEIAKNISDLFNVGTAVVAPEAAKEGAPNISAAVSSVADTVANAAGKMHDGINSLLESPNPVEAATKQLASGGTLVDRIQANAGSKNVDPRLQASAERLATATEPAKPGPGVQKGDVVKIDPVAKYDEFAKQASAAKTDIKADPPIATVGSRIGDAYQKVIQGRKAVGTQMGDALKAVKDVPTDISDTATNFEKSIEDKFGLKYNIGEQGFVQTGKQTPLGSYDQGLLNKYNTELRVLGPKPTVGDLDAFMKRIPNELDVAKAAKNITTVTPAEAAIKENLRQLREAFNPETTGNQALKPYYDARKSYANLSNFLDEGSSFLGKKTQSGDYARDTSLAKSSAESIINGGKKDWLLKLEGLTGYPALDESTLAIQAMKDVGDNRGLSLFKALGDIGTAPTPHGVMSRLVGHVVDRATAAVKGTPPQQTRAFLKSLSRQEPQVGTIGDYLKNIQPGLSMKADTSTGVSPANVAKNLNGSDVPLIQDYVNEPTLDNLMKLQPILEPMGVDKLDPAMLQRFFKEVIMERNSPNFSTKSTFNQDAKSGRMKGSRKPI